MALATTDVEHGSDSEARGQIGPQFGMIGLSISADDVAAESGVVRIRCKSTHELLYHQTSIEFTRQKAAPPPATRFPTLATSKGE
jgi:hypothetical protein